MLLIHWHPTCTHALTESVAILLPKWKDQGCNQSYPRLSESCKRVLANGLCMYAVRFRLLIVISLCWSNVRAIMDTQFGFVPELAETSMATAGNVSERLFFKCKHLCKIMVSDLMTHILIGLYLRLHSIKHGHVFWGTDKVFKSITWPTLFQNKCLCIYSKFLWTQLLLQFSVDHLETL